MNLHSLHIRGVWLLLIAVAACTHSRISDSPAPTEDAEMPFRFINEDKPPCLGMVKSFCKSLYSPSNLGKLNIPLRNESFEIRRGKTDNDFSQAYYEYAQTQLRFRDQLPREFRAILAQRSYFEKLKAYLARKPRKEMSLEDRVATLRLAGEIDAIWNGAMNETVLKRMERKFRGFSRMSEDSIPIELVNEGKRVRSTLVAEISKAIWIDHPNWKRVERTFATVKDAYRVFIAKNQTLSPEIREDWMERINSIRLMVPGGDPEMDMYDCSRTEENAYYYAKRNYLTVCAGDFNAEDITQTIAHEMAHALDVNRSLVIHEARSELGRQLDSLRERSCNGAQYSCGEWKRFKQYLPQYTSELATFTPQIPEFNSCLKARGTRGSLTEDYIERVAKEDVQDAVSTLAENHVFLRMLTPEIPMMDGSQTSNPAHMNPCGYYLWDNITPPFQEDLTLLMFFTTEYRCSPELAPEKRFQEAIEKAKEMQTEIVAARIRTEGEFSPRWRLNADGYAAPPGERFADALAGIVFSSILKKETDVGKRRATYLSNTGWLCSKPSLRHLLPQEAAILKQYYAEPHSENTIRQQELLSTDIREALACELDFEAKECTL